MEHSPASPLRRWCPRCLDFHVHFLHPEVYARTQALSAATCFGQQPLSIDSPRFKRMLDPARMLADMDEAGIDTAVISSADVLQSRSWTSPEEELLLTQMVNDRAAEWAALHPTRMIASFCLPLGDPTHTMRELERALRSGMKVANLPSNYRGSYLGEALFADMWSALHAAGATAFIHPDGVRDPWFQAYGMWNSIGQSIEEVKAMSSLIYEGVLERNRGLKIVMAHGGGYMPHYMGRLDRNASYRPQTMRNLSKLPSEYLRDFYYDSCVYDAPTLERLVAIVGADRIVLGGDYPFADIGAVRFLESAEALTDAQRASIAGNTAVELLGLQTSPTMR